MKLRILCEKSKVFFVNTETGENVDTPIRKVFHNDLIEVSSLNNFIVLESSVRDSVLAGVLVIGKTYGRSGRRLLYKCIPDNRELPAFLVPYDVPASFHKNVKNKYVVFRFENWDNDHPHGVLQHTIGDVDSVEAFYEYQLWRKNLNISLATFTNAARSKIKSLGADESLYINKILETSACKIRDCRSVQNVFTIDPEGCTDFDDAFSVTFEDRFATVHVYIANVFLWLETFGLWDFMTERVSTIYLPDRKVPMLPPLLSDSLCSLEQGRDRFAFCMSIKYDVLTKEVVEAPVYENVIIRINKNYVYEDADALNRNPAYRALRELAGTDDSHDVVAWWMIKMNTECAKYLAERGQGIFRLSVACDPAFFEHCASIYGKTPAPHRQLGVDAYMHITSPIRRLVDILNQILFMETVSESCRAFFDKWFVRLDDVNRVTRDIRRIQMDCELLAACTKNAGLMNRLFEGVVVDVLSANEYTVYIEELKLMSRMKSSNAEIGRRIMVKIFVFQDEHRLCRKIMVSIF
jgi:exoribonuclease R